MKQKSSRAKSVNFFVYKNDPNGSFFKRLTRLLVSLSEIFDELQRFGG